MRRNDLGTQLALLSRWMAIPTLVALVGSCAANKAHIDNEVEALQAGGDYGGCTVKVKSDGGTFRDWEKCACDVDVSHHVDSGKCAP